MSARLDCRQPGRADDPTDAGMTQMGRPDGGANHRPSDIFEAYGQADGRRKIGIRLDQGQ